MVSAKVLAHPAKGGCPCVEKERDVVGKAKGGQMVGIWSVRAKPKTVLWAAENAGWFLSKGMALSH